MYTSVHVHVQIHTNSDSFYMTVLNEILRFFSFSSKLNNYSNFFLLQLLTDCKLVCRILDGFDQNEKVSSEAKGRRLGYMGHLIRITNSLVQSGEGDESVRKVV